VQALSSGAGSYAATEAANAAAGQGLLDLLNAPTQLLFNRPLIGNGAEATTPGGPGGDGGDGGTAAVVGPGGPGGSGGQLFGASGSPGNPG